MYCICILLAEVEALGLQVCLQPLSHRLATSSSCRMDEFKPVHAAILLQPPSATKSLGPLPPIQSSRNTEGTPIPTPPRARRSTFTRDATTEAISTTPAKTSSSRSKKLGSLSSHPSPSSSSDPEVGKGPSYEPSNSNSHLNKSSSAHTSFKKLLSPIAVPRTSVIASNSSSSTCSSSSSSIPTAPAAALVPDPASSPRQRLSTITLEPPRSPHAATVLASLQPITPKAHNQQKDGDSQLVPGSLHSSNRSSSHDSRKAGQRKRPSLRRFYIDAPGVVGQGPPDNAAAGDLADIVTSRVAATTTIAAAVLSGPHTQVAVHQHKFPERQHAVVSEQLPGACGHEAHDDKHQQQQGQQQQMEHHSKSSGLPGHDTRHSCSSSPDAMLSSMQAAQQAAAVTGGAAGGTRGTNSKDMFGMLQSPRGKEGDGHRSKSRLGRLAQVHGAHVATASAEIADGGSFGSSRIPRRRSFISCKQQQQEEEEEHAAYSKQQEHIHSLSGTLSPLLGDGEFCLSSSSGGAAAAALFGAELRVHCCTFNMADTLPEEFPRELLQPPQPTAVAASRKGSLEAGKNLEVHGVSELAGSSQVEQMPGDGGVDMYVIATQVSLAWLFSVEVSI